MCECGKEQASNNQSGFGEDEEEVLVQPNTERIHKSSSDTTTVLKVLNVTDMQTLHRTSIGLQVFPDHLDTFFEMKLASFPVCKSRTRIMYIMLQCKGPASDWYTAMKAKQWISYHQRVGKFKRKFDNPHGRDNAHRNIE